MADDAVQPMVDRVREALHDIVDPELGIDAVDLGLVFGVQMDGDTALLDITLTSAACPLTGVIEGQIFQVLDGLVPGYKIHWVWIHRGHRTR